MRTQISLIASTHVPLTTGKICKLTIYDPDKIADDKNHVGMKNTQKRLEVMCKGELEIDSTPGGGTTVRMIIPD